MSSWPYVTFFLFALQLVWLKFNFHEKFGKTPDNNNSTEDRVFHFLELVEQHGRQAEGYNVTTDDGYILSLFRLVPTSIHHNASVKRPAIYLQHPLIASSDIFVLFGPGRSLAYTLSDAGYDVWLGNLRGNTYSRRHQSISPDDEVFWDFTMDHYALQDIPSMLDFILDHTKQRTLTYIGHSLGTTTGLMLLSTKPEYNDKINSLILLGPVSHWKSQNPTRTFLYFVDRLTKLVWSSSGKRELQAQGKKWYKGIVNGCTLHSSLAELCHSIFHLIVGDDPEQYDIVKEPQFFLYFPAGFSTRVFYHYSQHIETGEFKRYDYGDKDSNYKRYGEYEAPEYNVTNIVAPVVMFRAPNDPLSTKEDVDTLVERLRANTLAHYETLHYDEFGHADFVLAKDAEKLFHTKLLKILPQFQSCL